MTAPAPGPSAGPLPDSRAPSTGVAQALAALDGIEQRPVHEHVELFDGLHRALQDALAAIDEA